MTRPLVLLLAVSALSCEATFEASSKPTPRPTPERIEYLEVIKPAPPSLTIMADVDFRKVSCRCGMALAQAYVRQHEPDFPEIVEAVRQACPKTVAR